MVATPVHDDKKDPERAASGPEGAFPGAPPGRPPDTAAMAGLFDNALIGTLLSRRGRIEKINARGAAILGYAAGELSGRDVAALFPSAEAYEAFRAEVERDLTATGSYDGECRLRRKDGRDVDVRCQGRRPGTDDPDGTVVWAFDDVTGLRRMERDLSAARQAAAAAEAAKSRFLADIGHELRTPLGGISGMTRLLLETAESDELREGLEAIRQSVRALERIVGDLHELSRVEAGRLTLCPRVCDLKAELEPFLRHQAVQSGLRPFAFAYRFEPGLPSRVVLDPERLRRILANLLENAFASTQKGSVTVVAAPGFDAAGDGTSGGKARLAFTVTDTGPGIARERLEKVFEPFAVGEDALTRASGGAGLGLAVARRLAGLMGGDLRVASEPGRGSVFTLTLSCELPAGDRPEAAQTAGQAASPQGKTGLRILVAEDEPVNRIYTVRALQRLGHAVKTAADGREALAMLCREPFDLVLMDIQMPRLNGLDATRLIRSGQLADVPPSLPVVALTAYAMDEDRERGLAAGMDEYVVKPFEPEALAAAMARALSRKGA
ncbi:response regulator [Solidesulfovibrio sp.]|uniref:response regulator n=1 Tax=Solidesulfovibrio sp. TaxID=2910990 RepID=UPI0026182B85|nr:response regulator [Solidesulfovibrio sp.]